MYTVFRVMIPPAEIAALDQVIHAFDTRRAASEMDRRPQGDGYVVDLADDRSWRVHTAALLNFIEDNQEALAVAQ